jgi:hypothetical protein
MLLLLSLVVRGCRGAVLGIREEVRSGANQLGIRAKVQGEANYVRFREVANQLGIRAKCRAKQTMYGFAKLDIPRESSPVAS